MEMCGFLLISSYAVDVVLVSYFNTSDRMEKGPNLKSYPKDRRSPRSNSPTLIYKCVLYLTRAVPKFR